MLHTGPMVKILQILVLIEQINKYSQKKKKIRRPRNAGMMNTGGPPGLEES